MADDRAALLEKDMPTVSPARLEELVTIFRETTKLEIAFWDMGWTGR